MHRLDAKHRARATPSSSAKVGTGYQPDFAQLKIQPRKTNARMVGAIARSDHRGEVKGIGPNSYPDCRQLEALQAGQVGTLATQDQMLGGVVSTVSGQLEMSRQVIPAVFAAKFIAA